ncbi:hypothetical protein HDU76_000803 [Blyttiomyces sp. JEL0837]|nr:hypothetical protein HDU76_000803 [Blyttiomyces sp. JEL0837]
MASQFSAIRGGSVQQTTTNETPTTTIPLPSLSQQANSQSPIRLSGYLQYRAPGSYSFAKKFAVLVYLETVHDLEVVSQTYFSFDTLTSSSRSWFQWLLVDSNGFGSAERKIIKTSRWYLSESLLRSTPLLILSETSNNFFNPPPTFILIKDVHTILNETNLRKANHLRFIMRDPNHDNIQNPNPSVPRSKQHVFWFEYGGNDSENCRYTDWFQAFKDAFWDSDRRVEERRGREASRSGGDLGGYSRDGRSRVGGFRRGLSEGWGGNSSLRVDEEIRRNKSNPEECRNGANTNTNSSSTGNSNPASTPAPKSPTPPPRHHIYPRSVSAPPLQLPELDFTQPFHTLLANAVLNLDLHEQLTLELEERERARGATRASTPVQSRGYSRERARGRKGSRSRSRTRDGGVRNELSDGGYGGGNRDRENGGGGPSRVRGVSRGRRSNRASAPPVVMASRDTEMGGVGKVEARENAVADTVNSRSEVLGFNEDSMMVDAFPDVRTGGVGNAGGGSGINMPVKGRESEVNDSAGNTGQNIDPVNRSISHCELPSSSIPVTPNRVLSPGIDMQRQPAQIYVSQPTPQNVPMQDQSSFYNPSPLSRSSWQPPTPTSYYPSAPGSHQAGVDGNYTGYNTKRYSTGSTSSQLTYQRDLGSPGLAPARWWWKDIEPSENDHSHAGIGMSTTTTTALSPSSPHQSLAISPSPRHSYVQASSSQSSRHYYMQTPPESPPHISHPSTPPQSPQHVSYLGHAGVGYNIHQQQMPYQQMYQQWVNTQIQHQAQYQQQGLQQHQQLQLPPLPPSHTYSNHAYYYQTNEQHLQLQQQQQQQQYQPPMQVRSYSADAISSSGIDVNAIVAAGSVNIVSGNSATSNTARVDTDTSISTSIRSRGRGREIERVGSRSRVGSRPGSVRRAGAPVPPSARRKQSFSPIRSADGIILEKSRSVGDLKGVGGGLSFE